MISILIFIICHNLVKIVEPNSLPKKRSLNSKIVLKSSLYLLVACVMSFSFAQIAYAQDSSNSDGQMLLSENLLHDPLALDLLEKIEQTKKMIADLEKKEFEKNQAQELLQQKRDLSIERLNQSLDEWERLWEKHSSENSFERFVNKKPSFVQGVFWDQFNFKEQKVLAGKIAMSDVLVNGGTIQEAKNAYHKAATTQKIELIEMNAQFNIKHNLADYREQQIFNSTGQVHFSPATNAKLSEMYSDYKLQPGYIMANFDGVNNANALVDSETECQDGFVLVSRVTSDMFSCVDESVAKKWMSNGVTGIVIFGMEMPFSDVRTNPGTECDENQHKVIYDPITSEYRCVLESEANKMIEQGIAQDHTLVDYIKQKDKLKQYDDIIYEINQNIQQITKEYDAKLKSLESRYYDQVQNEDLIAKQSMQEIINDYATGDITKDDVSSQIFQIKNNSEKIKEKLSYEKLKEAGKHELQKKEEILKAVNGYEGNTDLNVNWDYIYGNQKQHDDTTTSVDSETEKKSSENSNGAELVKVSLIDETIDNIRIDSVGIVNSFGQKFDSIREDQVLQIAADITNLNDFKHNFAYVVEITDEQNNPVDSIRWMTGTLNPSQTFNVSLSWTPQETGQYSAKVSIGKDMNSVFQSADLEILVNPQGNINDESYCKSGHELLFKYSDYSPICVSSNVASKLINIGLAFA